MHGGAALASSAGKPADQVSTREIWIKSPATDSAMHALLFRPPGPGPFRAIILNHGSSANEDERHADTTSDFEPLARWLLARGYVVTLLERPGHGQSKGAYLETIGSCANPDYVGAGLGAASSILAAVAYLSQQPFVEKDGIILIGHSAGGWGALAAASESDQVRAVVNFAGGLGGHSYGITRSNCAPERLVGAARSFGERVRVPSLWLYADNDTYFGAALSQMMVAAFRASGAPVEFHLLHSAEEDGHFLMFSREDEKLWRPLLVKFLNRVLH